MQMPIYLKGEHLGARHCYYNHLVKSAVDQNVELQSVALTPGTSSPIERIFKIDLASKYRNVSYILETFKDDDMLYVSRALRCFWLLDRQYVEIINAEYLETNLFPQMIRPAVNKMRHWLQLNLKDPERCQLFYEYYKGKFDWAIKFLYHCTADCILKEISKVIDKINPQYLKILCERCPKVAEVYFENLFTNKIALDNYLKKEQNFFKSLRPILKKEGNLYLDIMEKYFNSSKMNKLNSSATTYIMLNFKNRFNAKRELYATMFLNMKSLVKHLNSDEAKDLVFDLAKANYLQSWFSYKNVEPLLKRLNEAERSQVKKQIFVDKFIKPCVEEWPYPTPAPPEPSSTEMKRVFVDKEFSPDIYRHQRDIFFRCLKKRKYSAHWSAATCCRYKSPLDILFDRYRVSGFEHTFQDLSKKILSECNIQGRLNMLLVLVSKSGGSVTQVTKLLQWLIKRHVNEPINVRSAVVRSLVTRGCAWRFPQNVWNLLLDFSRDLGLDGDKPELLCREGLHAVVIRDLLADNILEPKLLTSFIGEFSTLQDYNLNFVEKAAVGKNLAKLLVNNKPNYLLDIITSYRLEINQIPGAFDSLIKAAQTDTDLVHRLYNAKIGRRELMPLTFPLFQDCDSFINVLRHDVSLLSGGKYFAELIAKESSRCDRFLQSLSLYFREPNGLAIQHKQVLEKKIAENLNPRFARPLCFLVSQKELFDIISKLDNSENCKKEKRKLAAELRCNVHKMKPLLNMTNVDWKWMGAKAVANKTLLCRSIHVNANIELLLCWKKTARIAFRLALWSPYSKNTFIRLSAVRPLVALKVALSTYFRNDSIDMDVWAVVKKLIVKLHAKSDFRLLQTLNEINSVPKNIKSDYWVAIFYLNQKIDINKVTPIVSRLENMLPEVEKKTVEFIIKQFLSKSFCKEEYIKAKMTDDETCLYIRIIAKYILLCQSQSIQNDRLQNTCDIFFDNMSVLFKLASDNSIETEQINEEPLYEYVCNFLQALKYNKVFLDQKYVSCLPVFENIAMRMRKILPTEKHFDMYIEIHLTMLYYKSMKQAMKQKPEIFDDLEQNSEKAVEMVGLIFGTYIGHEIKELVSLYFFSIIHIYKKVLGNYLNHYFVDGDKTSLLVVHTLKGLLHVGHTEALLLVEYILRKKYLYFVPQSEENEISTFLKSCKNQEVVFLVQAYS